MNCFRRFIIGCLLLLAISVWAGYALLVTPRHHAEAQLTKQAQEHAQSISDQLEMALASKIEALQVLAYDLATHDVLTTSNRKWAAQNDVYAEALAIDEAWQHSIDPATVALQKELETGELSQLLRTQFEHTTTDTHPLGGKIFSEVIVTNRYGVNIAQTQRSSDYYQADETWWQQAQQAGLYVGAIEYDASTGDHGMAIACAMGSPSDDCLGVVKVWLNLKGLIGLLEQVTGNTTGQGTWILLVDAQGRVIHDQSGLYPFGADLSAIPLFGLLQGESGTFFRNEGLAADPWLFSYTRTRGKHLSAEQAWLLLLAYNANTVMETTQAMTTSGRWALGILILACFGVVLGCSHNGAHPSKALEHIVDVLEANEALPLVSPDDASPMGRMVQAWSRLTDEQRDMQTRLKCLKVDYQQALEDQRLLTARVERHHERQHLDRQGYWELDLETEHVTWSPALDRLFERSFVEEESLSLEKVLSIFDDYEADQLQTLLTQVASTGASDEWHGRLLLPSGGWITLRLQVHAVVEAPELTVQRLQGTFQDVTPLFRDQDQLRQSRQELQQLFSAAAPLCVVNRQQEIIRLNEAFCTLFGVTREDVAGLRCCDLLDAQKCDTDTCPIQMVLKNPSSFVFETEIGHNEAERRYLATRATPLWNLANSEIEGVVLNFIDVTEFKRTQHDLQQARQDLSCLHQQLVENERFALLGQWTTGMVHEVISPASIVISNLETLKRYTEKLKDILQQYQSMGDAVGQGDLDRAHEVLGHLLQSYETQRVPYVLEDLPAVFSESLAGLEQLTQTIRQMEAVTRPNESEDHQALNMNEAVTAALTVLKLEAGGTVDVSVDLGETHSISCRASHINHALLHVLMNAAQAVAELDQPKNGSVHIRTYMEDDQVVCQVTDNGPGMSELISKRAFDPFFTTRSLNEGAGLGLSLVRQIVVDQHGGDIQIESRPGWGTTVTLSLPLCEARATNPPQEEVIRV